MYYDNKSTFYIKQYGPAVLVGICSIVLIGSGLFIYFKNTSTNPLKIETSKQVNNKNTVVKPASENVETEALINDKKTESNEINYFENLKTLEKSKELNVKNVSDSGYITVETDNQTIEISLIGIDLNSVNKAAISKIKEDLLNKKVKVVFDTKRIEENKTYAYIYKNDSLYNETLLKSGLVTLRRERENVSLMGKLTKAQEYARENSIGVWKQ